MPAMESGTSVSGLTTAQLTVFLSKVGVGQGGLDSVWEKEVTGSMLCEFCEEDIKDVFVEFKDRFLIRKLLRDLADKPQSRHKPATLTTPPPYTGLHQRQGQRSPHQHGSVGSTSGSRQLDGKDTSSMHVQSSKLLFSDLVPSASKWSMSGTESEDRQLPSSVCSVSSVSKWPHRIGSNSSPQVVEVDEDEERKVFSGAKRSRLDEVLSVPKVPSSSMSLHALPLSSASRSPSTSSPADCFGQKALSPFSVFMSKPDIVTSISAAHSHTQASHLFADSDEQRMFGSGTASSDQALCLKKTVSSSQLRNETSSPATQPSSTTPDNLNFQDSKNLDFASAMAMKQLASKYSAPDILSKKAQRSRPSSPQKLGSVLIRNAAQQANLWVTAPCLRNITQSQKLAFLKYVYSIAPQLGEYEQLLWQRLSETLQNRRKYLLDKKLGKRGVNGSSDHVTSPHLLGGFSWDLSRHGLNSHELETMGEVNIGIETSDGQDAGNKSPTVKTEPE